MSLSNKRIKTQFPSLRLLDFEGAQAAANWVAVSETGTPSCTDRPGEGLDSGNALELRQGDDGTNLVVRRYLYNAAGWNCSGSELFTLVVYFDDIPSRQLAGGSGTLEITLSSNAAGFFTNSYLLILGGGTAVGTPTKGRNVWTFKTSDMTANAGGANMAAITNIRFRWNTNGAGSAGRIKIEGLWHNRRAMPACVFAWDDGWAEQGQGANEACTIANARGIPLSLYVIPDLIDGSNGATYLTEAEVASIAAAGNAIAAHGTGPSGVGDLTNYADSGLAHVQATQTWLRARGYYDDHYVYPGGAFNDQVLAVMRRCGMKSARTLAGIGYSAGPPQLYGSRGSYYLNSTVINGVPEWLQINAMPVNNLSLSLSAMKAEIDRAVSRYESIWLYGHRVGAAADSLYINVSDLTALCDHINMYRLQGRLDPMTGPQFYEAFAA